MQTHLMHTFSGHSGRVLAVQPLSPHPYLVTSGNDHQIKVWDSLNDREVITLQGHLEQVTHLRAFRSGDFLISAGHDAQIKIWNAPTGEVVRTLTGHAAPILSLALSHDGHTIVSGGADGTIRVWGTVTGHLIHTIQTDASRVVGVAITPDDQTIIASEAEAQSACDLRLYDLRKGTRIRDFAPSGDCFTNLITLKNGTCITAARNGNINLWDCTTGEILHKLMPANGIMAMTIDPHQKYLLVGTNQSELIIYDLEAPEKPRQCERPADTITALAITKSGQRCIAGCENGIIHYYSLYQR